MNGLTRSLIAGLIVIVVGTVLLWLARWSLRRAARRHPVLRTAPQRLRHPTQVLIGLAGVGIVLAGFEPSMRRHELRHLLTLAVIAASAWFVVSLLRVGEDVSLSRFPTDVRDNRSARRVHTQVTVLRQFLTVVVAVVAVGVMLMTFPRARFVGTSVLASAGIVGVVAGFAAQTLLGNLIAGVQLAFSDALRLDDVVVVENEWGRVETLTMTYVVVRVWDDRRLVLPTSYFLSRPFQNWTRDSAAVLGTIEVDVDWAIPVPAMREQLQRIVAETELWDGRVCVLQVTEAVGQNIRVRALVSAADAPTLWDLRCLVREQLVAWVRERHPEALPRLRLEPEQAPAASPPTIPSGADTPFDGVDRRSPAAR